jgi:hypothetical protein
MRHLFCFSKCQKPVQDTVVYYLSKSSAGFAQIIYVQLQFFDHLAHKFIAKELQQLHLTQALEAPFDAVQRRIGVTFLLDDVPFCPADRPAKGKEGLPVDVTFPE